MLASAVLLALVGSGVLISEIYTTRTALTKELQILSNTLSANCQQPLAEGDYSKVNTLLRSLIHQNNIHAAYVFDHRGVAVAKYSVQKDSQFVLQSIQSDFSESQGGLQGTTTKEQLFSSLNHFSMIVPILYAEKPIGSLYLLSDLENLYRHLGGVVLAVTVTFLLLIALSWILAGWMQKPILIPLIHLAGLMEKVSADKDYSVRAKKQSDDEIGILVEGFNQMLQQIELDRIHLAKHQSHLERLVSDRTIELREAVADLELARERAEAANEAKSDFLSRMTHELRTPLVGVLGMNELMMRTTLTEQQQLLVDTIHKSGQQLLALISDILDFSRIEAGKLFLELNDIRLDRTIDDVVALLTPQADEKGLVILVDISPTSRCRVQADETRIRQILMNLIGNAIKFTSSGSISVRLNCFCEGASGVFVLEIADTGVGMPAEVMQQIFDIFYQQDGAGTGVGTGLGLAIVKQLVELMDGKLSVISTPEKGSQFQVTVTLPLVADIG